MGFSAAANGDRAFLWDAGTLIDLNDVITGGLGWTLTQARAINTSGQIVGYGTNADGNTEAFLLTPVSDVPLPGALPLLAGGLGLAGLIARRRRRG